MISFQPRQLAQGTLRILHDLPQSYQVLQLQRSEGKKNLQFHPLSHIPSGKRLHNYGKSPCFMGKLTISMGHFPVRKLLEITRHIVGRIPSDFIRLHLLRLPTDGPSHRNNRKYHLSPIHCKFPSESPISPFLPGLSQ